MQRTKLPTSAEDSRPIPTEHTCTKHAPGSLSCHRHHGCRCAPCKRAYARAHKRSHAGLVNLVDATPAREHLARLLAAGYTLASVAKSAGLDINRVHYLYHHGRRTAPAAVSAILAVKAPTVGMVSSAGTARRIQALAVNGWRLEDLGDRLGVGATTVCHWAARPQVSIATETAMRALYAELWSTPGPSKHAAARARRLGHAPALGWDDGIGPHGIDNPDAKPWAPTAGRVHTIDMIADAAHLGYTATETAAALGIQRDTVYATCRRHDELDLWERLTRQEAS